VVSANGVGVPDDQKEEIFDKDEQGMENKGAPQLS
jgi:hypothetical protein